MKIKKLIIRNIASIEKADIDFEKDLIDSGTGLPASMQVCDPGRYLHGAVRNDATHKVRHWPEEQ